MNEFFAKLLSGLKSLKVWTVVHPWERGVRVRLGRHTKLLERGVHPRIPFVDTVFLVNTRQRIANAPMVTVSSKDGRTWSVAGNVAFRIEDPALAMMATQQPEHSCGALAQALMTRYISEHISEDLNVAALETWMTGEMRNAGLRGFEFDYVSVIDFAAVRTFRMLNENWRPATRYTDFDEMRDTGVTVK